MPPFPIRKIFNQTYLTELIVIVFFTTLVFIFSSQFDVAEHIYNFTQRYELYELDEVLNVTPVWLFLMLSVTIISFRRYYELVVVNVELKRKNAELQKAMDEIRQLKGIIPICSNCKNIRDDEGYWSQVEAYISNHSEAQFTHGICPDCARKHYGYVPMEDSPSK